METLMGWYNVAIEYNTYIYIVASVLCFIGYAARCWKDFNKDKANCANAYYEPTLTIGLIVWRLICSFFPVFNVLALVFDLSASYGKLIINTLDIPLVKHKHVKSA